MISTFEGGGGGHTLTSVIIPGKINIHFSGIFLKILAWGCGFIVSFLVSFFSLFIFDIKKIYIYYQQKKMKKKIHTT